MNKLYPSLVLLLLLSGCATSSVVMLDSAKYPPSAHTQLMMELPTGRKYKQIAFVEAKGMPNMSITTVMEELRVKAQDIGADAVIPTQDASTQQQQGIIYNPYLGGYQSTGGGTTPVIRGIAIRYTEAKTE